MLEPTIARSLAQKIAKHLGYNINIMNERGIIIASGDSKRIGDFHEIAYRIVKDQLDVQVVREEDTQLIGVKPGVNMPIVYDGQVIGVIGISGHPDDIMNFAYIVRMSMETMLEYELYKEQVQRRQTYKNTFLNALLFEEPANEEKILGLAKDLGYNEKLTRVPILLKTWSSKEIDVILEQIKNISEHTKQDISMLIDHDHILVFKVIDKNMVRDYKKVVAKYIESANTIFKEHFFHTKCYYFIGSMQNQLVYYRQAYHHASWLEKYKRNKKSDFHFFMDHILQYIQENLPFEIFDSIFSIYGNMIDGLGHEMFVETVSAFYNNGMNINRTAQQLFLHRNTVVFRLNKIKEKLGIDPMNSICDQQFLFQLLYYCQGRNATKHSKT